MKLGSLLLRELTNVTTAGTQTFNSPGTYYPPYGKTTLKLSGRGEPGNPNSGGNFASNNPATPGNYAGTNPTTPGNTDATYNYVTLYVFITFSPDGNSPYPGSSGGHTVDAQWTSGYCPFGFFIPCHGHAVVNYYPRSPHGPVFRGYTTNPASPGNAYYNPSTPGNANYNPFVPGNTGPSNTVLGISLPGGSAASPASTVNATPVSISYTNAGVSITVPTGGYVAIQNLLPNT